MNANDVIEILKDELMARKSELKKQEEDLRNLKTAISKNSERIGQIKEILQKAI